MVDLVADYENAGKRSLGKRPYAPKLVESRLAKSYIKLEGVGSDV